MMNDARLRTLEERIVQLEDLVEQLNIVVASQADQLDFLRSALRASAEDGQPIGPHNDPPPHY